MTALKVVMKMRYPHFTSSSHLVNSDVTSVNDFEKTGDSCGSMLYQAVYYLQRNYVPVLAFLGLVGNFFLSLIYLKSHLRAHSYSWYLVARAVADSGFLISMLMVWLSNF